MSNITAIGLCVTIFAASTAAGSVAMMITDILDERKERRKMPISSVLSVPLYHA